MTEAQVRVAGVFAEWLDERLAEIGGTGMDAHAAAISLNADLRQSGVLDLLTRALNAAGEPGAEPLRFRGAYVPRPNA